MSRSRIRNLLLCLLVLATAMVPAAAVPQSTNDIQQSFVAGNAAYESGDYGKAIEHYRGLVDTGVENPDLYYNLANAYYKSNNLARAVLFYERTLRLTPREKDARENLSLLRRQLKDRQFVREQNRFVRNIVVLHSNLNPTEMFTLATISYLLLCCLVIVFVFRDAPPVVAVYRRVSIVSPGRFLGLTRLQDFLFAIGIVFVLSATTTISTSIKVSRERGRREAVVLPAEVAVLGSPTEDATLQFKVHEGTTVIIREQSGNWLRIQLPGGLSGWVAAQAVERV
ncbi:MAG: tetratricopeptide repeat protein [bacterium]|nr:tetratricopeptide repeat protein [bacterium]